MTGLRSPETHVRPHARQEHVNSTESSVCLVAGEYGELLLSKANAPLQDGEEAMSVSSQDLVQVLETVLSRQAIKPVGREYALTALMKLSTRLPDHSQYIQVLASACCSACCIPCSGCLQPSVHRFVDSVHDYLDGSCCACSRACKDA